MVNIVDYLVDRNQIINFNYLLIISGYNSPTHEKQGVNK